MGLGMRDQRLSLGHIQFYDERKVKMRMPKENENLIGKVCVCSVGRVGIVTGKGSFKSVVNDELIECWKGLGLDGKGVWASTSPCIVAESGQEFADKLSERFGGKMSYNS